MIAPAPAYRNGRKWGKIAGRFSSIKPSRSQMAELQGFAHDGVGGEAAA